MSLDKLTSPNPSSTNPTQNPPTKIKRSYAWLLPVGLVTGFIAIMLLLFGDRLRPSAEVSVAPVITLRSAAEESAPISNTPVTTKGDMLFQASGWIEPDPYITYVPALVNGIVKEVHVLEGQPVKKGQLLATLIDDDAKLDLKEAEQDISNMKSTIAAHCRGIDIAQAELAAARKSVETAQAQLADAQDNLDRLKRIAAGAIPKQQVIQAELKVRQLSALRAEAQAHIPRIKAKITQIDEERVAMETKIEKLETMRARAQLALDRTKISSPMDGIVLHLHAAPGKKRMLNMDDPKSSVIVELYDPAKLQARIDVPLNEAAALQRGQSVELLSDLLPDKTFHGKVTLIAGQADLQRNTLQVKVAIKKPDVRLRPDMLVRAKFFATSTASKSGNTTTAGRLSIYVPESALFSNNQVWVIDPEGKATRRTLELGSESKDGHRRVISGLKSGEKVILPPHDELTEGAPVRVKSSN